MQNLENDISEHKRCGDSVCLRPLKSEDNVCPASQVYSQHGSLLSSSPQHSLGSESERTFNLNDSSVPTATQALMTMYRRRSPEEFNPKLVGKMLIRQVQLKAYNLDKGRNACRLTVLNAIKLFYLC